MSGTRVDWNAVARALAASGCDLTDYGRQLAGPPKLRTVCAWCDTLIHPGTEPNGTTSHGICGACERDFEADIA